MADETALPARVTGLTLLVGAEMGFFAHADVVCWADDQIERSQDPPMALIELSMSSSPGHREHPD